MQILKFKAQLYEFLFYTNSATDHNYYYYCYYYHNYYATDMGAPQTENTKMMRMDKISKSQQKKLQLVFWKENGLACFPKCLKLRGETTSTLK